MMILDAIPCGSRGRWRSGKRLARSSAHARLLEEFPAGVHGRPEGAGESPVVLLILDIRRRAGSSRRSRSSSILRYGEIVLPWDVADCSPRSPRTSRRLPRHVVDGGYYTKTRENRVLASPLPVEGAYSARRALGLRTHGVERRGRAPGRLHRGAPVAAANAPAFRLDRYDDPAYRALLARWGDSGQL